MSGTCLSHLRKYLQGGAGGWSQGSLDLLAAAKIHRSMWKGQASFIYMGYRSITEFVIPTPEAHHQNSQQPTFLYFAQFLAPPSEEINGFTRQTNF